MFILIVQALLLCTLCSILWCLLRNQIVKSPLHDLPGPQRFSIISGNLKQLFSPNGIPWHHAMTKQYGRVFKFHGFFGNEQVYVTDPRALHHIIVKDQYIYEATSMFIESAKLILGESLMSTLGDRHKKQRKMLNPVFSIAHMRNLIPIFYGIAHQVRNVLARKVKDGPQEINMLYWFSLTALESIGQAGMGHSLENVENETPTNAYTQAIRDMSSALSGLAISRQFVPYLVRLGPPWFREFLLQFIPSRNLQKLKKIADLMHQMAVEVFTTKKKALDEGDEALARQVDEGKDIMSIFLKANATADEADRLPESEILGQINLLVIAGHNTTANALARILHLLAQNPEVQGKLRQEITEARAGGDLPYDELMALPYLDAVVRESMRLYAPVTFVMRTTRKDTVLPLGTPIKSADGKRDIHEIFLKNNTDVVVGIAAANRDPAVWVDEPEVWKPDRWIDHSLDEIVKERLPGVYAGMMTFIGGGRACIGFKFAELEMKVVLSVLLETLIFELSDSDIVWRNNNVATPTTKGRETETPHLPLMVSLAAKVIPA